MRHDKRRKLHEYKLFHSATQQLTPRAHFPHRAPQGENRDRPTRLRPKYRVHPPQNGADAMPALDTITTSLLTRRIGIPDDHAVGETDN